MIVLNTSIYFSNVENTEIMYDMILRNALFKVQFPVSSTDYYYY